MKGDLGPSGRSGPPGKQACFVTYTYIGITSIQCCLLYVCIISVLWFVQGLEGEPGEKGDEGEKGEVGPKVSYSSM